ncbi:unnamed protein product [Closterium sp. NIES-65]|nr:unnamed protein product [Closterium sp. NIES-65]
MVKRKDVMYQRLIGDLVTLHWQHTEDVAYAREKAFHPEAIEVIIKGVSTTVELDMITRRMSTYLITSRKRTAFVRNSNFHHVLHPVTGADTDTVKGLVYAHPGPSRPLRGPVAAPVGPVDAASGPVADPSGPVADPSGPVAASGPVADPSGPVAASGPVADPSGPVTAPIGPVAASSGPVAATCGPVAAPFGPSSTLPRPRPGHAPSPTAAHQGHVHRPPPLFPSPVEAT